MDEQTKTITRAAIGLEQFCAAVLHARSQGHAAVLLTELQMMRDAARDEYEISRRSKHAPETSVQIYRAKFELYRNAELFCWAIAETQHAPAAPADNVAYLQIGTQQ